MPSQSKDVFELAKQLNADPNREAVASQRGYDWQRWLTVEKWLELEGEDDLWIEFGEDVTTVSVDGVETVQAKDRDGTVSLGLAHVREMLELAFQRDANVRTVLWTTSRLTLEQKKPFGEVPGIEYWAAVQDGTSPLGPLRRFLDESLDASVATKLRSMSDEVLLSAIRRIQFITDEVGIESLRRRVLGKLEPRLAALGLKNASVVRENYGRAIFEYISRKSTRERNERRLDRVMLDEEILKLHSRFQIAGLPSNLDQTNEVVEGLLLKINEAIDRRVDGKALGPAAQATVAAALERDLRSKYHDRMARSLFDEAQPADELSLLGEEVASGQYDAVPRELRQDILLRASRSSSLRGKLADAKRFLGAAQVLGDTHSQKPARARLLAAEGDPDAALQEIENEGDAESYSTCLSILLREKGSVEALEYYRNTGRADLLTASGFTTMSAALVDDRAAALQLLEVAPDEIIKANPMIAMRRGLLRLSSVFEEEAQASVLAGIPIDARALPNVAAEKRRKPLDDAIKDFSFVRNAAQELGLPRAAAIASSYERWAELLHPDRANDALTQLRKDVAGLTPEGLISVQFAFAFDPAFDPTSLRDQLSQKGIGGALSDDEFRAAVTIALHDDSPAEMANFVAKHRETLNRDYGEPGTLQIEIQALAKSGDAGRARDLLERSVDKLNPDARPFLEAVVGAAEGKDPVQVYTRAYEENPTNESLRTLLRVLSGAQRWETFAQRAEELYSKTGLLEVAGDAARAYVRLEDDENFLLSRSGNSGGCLV